MTLGRLVVAWLVVVVWFAIATIATATVVAHSQPPAGETPHPDAARDRILKWRVVEAGLLTLIASLWFDSLGSGEAWLIFLLIGALVALPAWLRTADVPRRVLVANSLADLARYAVAGVLLAWRLS